MCKDIVIFSARVARDLIQKRFNLIDIKPDRKCKIKTIFYFENTKELRNYLSVNHNIKIKC